MSEQYYDTLQTFLTESGTSALDFADRIRMFSEMFKELLNTRSKMTIGTFTSVIVGFKAIVDEEENFAEKKQLQKLFSQFYSEYLAECSESFHSATNPHFQKRIEEMAKFAGPEQYAKVHQLYHPNDPIQEEAPAKEEAPVMEKTPIPASVSGDPLKALASVLASLNEDGIYEVLKRARELTYVPEYKK